MDLSLKILDSVSLLRQHAEKWDDLWRRSSVSHPGALAEPLAIWVEQFARNIPFRAVVVENPDRFLVALPLIGEKKGKLVSAGVNTSNSWNLSGQLIIDNTVEERIPVYLDVMIRGLKKLPFSILWLDYVRQDTLEWTAFREALVRNGVPSQWHERFLTAVFPLDGPFESMKSKWRKKATVKIRKLIEKQYAEKGYSFEILENEKEILDILPACFELEHHTWKGQVGGGIIRRGMESFYLSLAKYYAEHGLMKLAILRYGGELIAFNYCFTGKNTIYLQKTSYVSEYKDIWPGQVLQYLQNEQLSADPTMKFYDFVGEYRVNQGVWNAQKQANAQVVVPLNGLGRLFFTFYDTIMPRVRKWRDRKKMKESENSEGSCGGEKN